VKVEERWNEVKQEPQQAQEAASSPMTVLKKEERMTRKKCSYPGCDKGSWLKGLCHKHYIEKYGEYVPAKKRSEAVLPKEAHNKAVEEFAYPVTPPEPEKSKPAKHCPNLALYIPDEMYEKIVQLAEREYRPVAWQVQYLLHKGMETVGAVGV